MTDPFELMYHGGLASFYSFKRVNSKYYILTQINVFKNYKLSCAYT